MDTILNISLPTSWSELTQTQLYFALEMIARQYTATQIKTRCLMRYAGLVVVRQLSNHKAFVKKGKKVYPISTVSIRRNTRCSSCSRVVPLQPQ